MDSYEPIFKQAEEVAKVTDYLSTFPTFHDHPELFHFIIAPKNQYGRDLGALSMAETLDPEVYKFLVDKGPSLLGNGATDIDGVESRHIFVLTYLISKLGKDWGDVLEIGGGYGNYLRLVQGLVSYDSWSIIDLDYILELQKWFIESNNIYKDNLNFVSNKNIEYQSMLNPYLTIGVHSLSEISLEDFKQYMPIISKSTWFYYITQRENPSVPLLVSKLDCILENFTIEAAAEYEGGISLIFLFKNKVIP